MESTRNMRIASRLILFALLASALALLLPVWPYNSTWGYYPSMSVVVLLIILAALFFRAVPRNL